MVETLKGLSKEGIIEGIKGVSISCKYEVRDGEIIVEDKVKVKTHLKFHKLWKNMIMMGIDELSIQV